MIKLAGWMKVVEWQLPTGQAEDTTTLHSALDSR